MEWHHFLDDESLPPRIRDPLQGSTYINRILKWFASQMKFLTLQKKEEKEFGFGVQTQLIHWEIQSKIESSCACVKFFFLEFFLLLLEHWHPIFFGTNIHIVLERPQDQEFIGHQNTTQKVLMMAFGFQRNSFRISFFKLFFF